MCERLGTHKTRTTALHPQSDGLVERFNRTLAQQLSILTAEHQRDWDTHLPLVLMAYRSAVQDSTSCTPALLMLGRELRTPAEVAFGKPPDTFAVPPGPEYARSVPPTHSSPDSLTDSPTLTPHFPLSPHTAPAAEQGGLEPRPQRQRQAPGRFRDFV